MSSQDKTWVGSLLVFSFIYLSGYAENAYHGIGCIGGISIGALMFITGFIEQ